MAVKKKGLHFKREGLIYRTIETETQKNQIKLLVFNLRYQILDFLFFGQICHSHVKIIAELQLEIHNFVLWKKIDIWCYLMMSDRISSV